MYYIYVSTYIFVIVIISVSYIEKRIGLVTL